MRPKTVEILKAPVNHMEQWLLGAALMAVIGLLAAVVIFLYALAQPAHSADRLSILQSEPANKQDIAKLEFRVKELERKVAGMQKQITILHAKKQK